jgi:uncharacterized protein (DUF4415 family)
MKRKKKAKAGKTRGLRAAEDSSVQPDWEKLRSLYRPIKRSITLRLDADVVDWFKKAGRGYQTRINRALRGLMVDEMKKRK